MLLRVPDTAPVNTIVKYGNFAFHEHGIPVPFVTMEQEMLNDHSGRWGRIDNISINGVISGTGFADGYGSGLIGMQSGLISGFSSDFEAFFSQDLVNNYVKSGFTLTAGSGLAVNIAVGVARLKGFYISN